MVKSTLLVDDQGMPFTAPTHVARAVKLAYTYPTPPPVAHAGPALQYTAPSTVQPCATIAALVITPFTLQYDTTR
jgi:hypothetical protein